jgi:thymidylate synthase (FAD)
VQNSGFWDRSTNEGRERYEVWKKSMEEAEKKYFKLLELGASPQEARSVLPNSLKTELVVTMNIREWRHFIKLRASDAAHPQIREIAIPLLKKFKELIPVLFEDIMP